VTELKFTASFE